MTQKILTKKEIGRLISILKDSFRNLDKQRQMEPLARHIQYPKIPSILSESIAYYLIHEKKILRNIDIIDIALSHKIADIILHTKRGTKKVEVKSTGQSAFQYFGIKDIVADFLVWLHFGNYFTNKNNSSMEVYIIDSPGDYFIKPLKINLKKIQTSGLKLKKYSFKLQ